MAEKKKLIPLPKLDLTNTRQGFLILLIGIVAALFLGALASGYNWALAWAYWVLAIGVVVGILNIFHKEGILFLISGLTITFMLYVLSGLMIFPAWAVTLFYAVIYLLAPASIVVGLKVLYSLATK